MNRPPPEPSARLRSFLAPSMQRPRIHELVAELARQCPAGARVLDAGAGSAPYRELFEHCDYVTTDWEHSIYEEGRSADIVASLDALPVEDGSFDAALATEVLEHVVDPGAALGELHRVLVPGGLVLVTVPFVWELHEEPYDYFRYTHHAMAALLEGAGFREIEALPLTGYFTTIAQLVAQYGSATGARDGGFVRHRVSVALALLVPRAIRVLAALDRRLDRRRLLPLGFALRARRG
jgi:ubiquinone/menaquinone biosynthesis C-methylase UbiE